MKRRSKLTLLLLCSLLISLPLWSQQNPHAYTIYNKKGEAVSYDTMLRELTKSQVIFFGELHNNPICHWLEFHLTKDLYDHLGHHLGMGAEMFEADDQLKINEYLQGIISENNFEKEMKLWPNYETDYIKLMEFAKENHLSFTATNIPRRYAHIVSVKGLAALDSLSPEAKRYIAPLPIPYVTDSTQTAFFSMMGGMTGHTKRNPEYMAEAQAVKDATMAYRIAQSLKGQESHLIHFNGVYHTDLFHGIIPFLRGYKPGIRYKTISCCTQDDISQLGEESIGRADYIICIPSDMVSSY